MAKAKDFGRVHVLTGRGRGKTTSAFGLAMRASGHGYRICVVQFMKTGETTGEVLAARKLKNIEVSQFGTGKFVDPKHVSVEDRRCAKKALDFCGKALSRGGCDILILDEVNVAVSLGLIRPQDVIRILGSRPRGVEIVLTGRGAPKEFIDLADYVSVIEDRKHPFDDGLKARKGIEW